MPTASARALPRRSRSLIVFICCATLPTPSSRSSTVTIERSARRSRRQRRHLPRYPGRNRADARRAARRRDDDEEDEEEDADPDDVEADLDEILKDRIAAGDDEEDEEEEDDADAGKGGTPSARIQPRREDEFLCQSCFILKPMGQLADGEDALCVDCV